MLAHLRQVVQHRDHGAAFLVPVLHQPHQVGGGAGVDRVERLVEQDHRRVLHQHTREQHALELADRELRDQPLLEAGQPDRRQREQRLCALRRGGAGEPADARPGAEHHDIEHAERKAAVDARLLRQVGQPVARQAAGAHAAGAGLHPARQRVEQRALAGAVGADHGGEGAGLEAAADVVHRRVMAVADGEIFDGDRRRRHHRWSRRQQGGGRVNGGNNGAHGVPDSAQATVAQSSALNPTAPASRSSAELISRLATGAGAGVGSSSDGACAWAAASCPCP